MPGWRLGGLTTPVPAVEPEWWFEADSGVTVATSQVDWADKTSHHRDVVASLVGLPTFVPVGINGLPSFQSGDSTRMNFTGANIFAQGDPRTVIAVCRPAETSPGSGVGGGYLAAFRRSDRDFALGLWSSLIPANTQFVYTNCVDGANNIIVTPKTAFFDQDLLVVWEFDGANLTTKVNGVTLTVDQSVTGPEDGVATGFSLFGISCSNLASFLGLVSAEVCYALPTAPAAMLSYLSSKYGVG